MKIIKEAIAGTLESSDLQVKVAPQPSLELVIHSEVWQQFGEQIQQVVHEVLHRLSVTEGLIIVEDKGALDCAIRARVQTAILRGAGEENLDWSSLS